MHRRHFPLLPTYPCTRRPETRYIGEPAHTTRAAAPPAVARRPAPPASPCTPPAAGDSRENPHHHQTSTISQLKITALLTQSGTRTCVWRRGFPLSSMRRQSSRTAASMPSSSGRATLPDSARATHLDTSSSVWKMMVCAQPKRGVAVSF